MTAEQFAYWLQGYTELTAGQQPTPEQWKSITEHLKTVFVKVTPEVKVQINPGVSGEQLAEQIRKIVRDGVHKGGPLFSGPNWSAPLITC